jgi:hypothetical protein
MRSATMPYLLSRVNRQHKSDYFKYTGTEVPEPLGFIALSKKHGNASKRLALYLTRT